MKNIYVLKNLNSPKTAIEIEDHLNESEGVISASINFNKSFLIIETKISNKEKPYISNLIKDISNDVKIVNPNVSNNNTIALIIIFIGLGIILGSLGIIYSIKILILLSFFFLLTNKTINLINTIKKTYSLNEDIIFILTGISFYFVNKPLEGLILLTLMNLLDITKILINNKHSKYIEKHINIKYDLVNVIKDGKEYTVNPETIRIGDTIVSRAGETIAVDGIIRKGSSTINTEYQSGYPNLTKVTVNDRVYSGTINLLGDIEIETITDFDNSTANRTTNLLKESLNTKIKKDNYLKIPKYLSITIIIIGILYSIIMPLFFNLPVKETLYRFFSLLFISETSSIFLSVPLLYNIAVYESSTKGIIIKDHNFIKSLHYLKKVIFNNTSLFSKEKTKDYILQILNKHYSKNIILEYYSKGEKITKKPLTNVSEYYDIVTSKRGVKNIQLEHNSIYYEYKKDKILIGDYHILDNPEKDNYIYLKINNKLVSKITLKETVEENIINTLNELNNLNIKTYLLTSKNKEKINNITSDLNIDEIRYNLNFDQKYLNLKNEIISTKGLVALIGSNKYDASALELSDIGISIYGIENDASSSSDIIIKDKDLTKLIKTINIANKINKRVLNNILLYSIIKIILVILSLLGLNRIYIIPIMCIIIILLTTFNIKKILKSKDEDA